MGRPGRSRRRAVEGDAARRAALGAVEHGGHVDAAVHAPAKILVERLGCIEHIEHIRDFVDLPVVERLVELTA